MMYPNGDTSDLLDNPDWFLSDVLYNTEDLTYRPESYKQLASVIRLSPINSSTLAPFIDAARKRGSANEGDLFNQTEFREFGGSP